MKSNTIVKHKCDSFYCCKSMPKKTLETKKKKLQDKKKSWLNW